MQPPLLDVHLCIIGHKETEADSDDSDDSIIRSPWSFREHRRLFAFVCVAVIAGFVAINKT